MSLAIFKSSYQTASNKQFSRSLFTKLTSAPAFNNIAVISKHLLRTAKLNAASPFLFLASICSSSKLTRNSTLCLSILDTK